MKNFSLDLSARAYPLMITKKTQSMFRITIELQDNIIPDLLLQSMQEIITRYPAFNTRIKFGFFWHKFTKNNKPIKLAKKDFSLLPLRDTNGYPFRLFCQDNKILLDVFHAVTDGNIALRLANDLLHRYLELIGVNECTPLPKIDLTTNDDFIKNAQKIRFSSFNLKDYDGGSATGLGDKPNYSLYNTLITEEMSFADLKANAIQHGATVTEFIVSAYITAILQSKKLPLKKQISIFLPVNLRSFFPSDTSLNFVCFERVILPKGFASCDLKDVIPEVSKQLKAKLTKERMQKNINSLYKCINLPLVNYCPLFIKLPLFKFVKFIANKVRQTAIISNIGNVQLESQVAPHVQSITLHLNTSKNAPLNMCVTTSNGICRLNISSLLKKTDIPQKFIDLLHNNHLRLNPKLSM